MSNGSASSLTRDFIFNFNFYFFWLWAHLNPAVMGTPGRWIHSSHELQMRDFPHCNSVSKPQFGAFSQACQIAGGFMNVFMLSNLFSGFWGHPCGTLPTAVLKCICSPSCQIFAAWQFMWDHKAKSKGNSSSLSELKTSFASLSLRKGWRLHWRISLQLPGFQSLFIFTGMLFFHSSSACTQGCSKDFNVYY